MPKDFTELRVPRLFLERYPPDPNKLLDFLCPRISPRMVEDIASSDHGAGTEANRAALNRIVEGEDRGQTMFWEPDEVLRLYRWSSEASSADLTPQEFHLARAFSCACLLNMPDEHGNRSRFSNESVAPLIESILTLDAEFHEPLLRLFAWMLQELEVEDQEYLFCAFGLFAFLSLSGSFDADLLLGEIGDWVLKANAHVAPWRMFGLTLRPRTFLHIPFITVSREKWRALARQMIERTSSKPEWREFLVSLASR